MSFCTYPGCANEAESFALLLSERGETAECRLCKEHVHLLGFAFEVPEPRPIHPSHTSDAYLACKLRAVYMHHKREKYLLFLNPHTLGSVFVSSTGFIEASTITHLVKGLRHSRPQTHVLLASAVGAMGGTFHEAVVSGYDDREKAFQCNLSISGPKGEVSLPCRVSDAVAISVATGMPIRVRKALLVDEQKGEKGESITL